MNQAAKWIDQALDKNPDAYFMHYKKAQIQAKLGNKKEATASAQKTIDILKKDKAPDESAIKNAQQIIDSSKRGPTPTSQAPAPVFDLTPPHATDFSTTL